LADLIPDCPVRNPTRRLRHRSAESAPATWRILLERCRSKPVRNPAWPDKSRFRLRRPGAKVVLVDGKNVTGPVTFNGTNVQAGAVPTTLALSGGSIKGALDTRDGAVEDARNNIQLARRPVVTSVQRRLQSDRRHRQLFQSGGTTARLDPTRRVGLTPRTLKQRMRRGRDQHGRPGRGQPRQSDVFDRGWRLDRWYLLSQHLQQRRHRPRADVGGRSIPGHRRNEHRDARALPSATP